MLDQKKFYINGEWILPAKDETIDIVNPSDESVVGTLNVGSKADIDKAVEAVDVVKLVTKGKHAPALGRTCKRQLSRRRARAEGAAQRGELVHLTCGVTASSAVVVRSSY